jgi:recombination protein RecT
MAPAVQPNTGNGSKTEIARHQQGSGPLATLMGYIQSAETQRRLKEMLDKRAGAFANSIINVVKGSKQLMDIAKVNPASIMSSAMVAASVNLPIDAALGFAAIVPYSGKNPAAQFQLMYKGLIQLAIRSGQYERIHDTEVYKDEIESYNPITGEIRFTDPPTWKMRAEGDPRNVAGFYTFFRLKTGFEASKYISFDEAMAHGRRFSKSFQADLHYAKASSLWSTDPISMGRKTCIKMLIGKYGILSIDLQEAFVSEADDFAPEGPQHIESRVVEGPEIGGVEGLKARMQPEGLPEGPSDPTPEPASTQEEPPGPAASSTPEARANGNGDSPTGNASSRICFACKQPAAKLARHNNHLMCPACIAKDGAESEQEEQSPSPPMWHCLDCQGAEFPQPKAIKVRGEMLYMCPHCESINTEPVGGKAAPLDQATADKQAELATLCVAIATSGKTVATDDGEHFRLLPKSEELHAGDLAYVICGTLASRSDNGAVIRGPEDPTKLAGEMLDTALVRAKRAQAAIAGQKKPQGKCVNQLCPNGKTGRTVDWGDGTCFVCGEDLTKLD